MAEPSLLEALLLGIVEGVTEFLPVSSTGHLLILQTWMPRRSDLFNVAIQSGAIAAVTLVYRERLVELMLQWREPRSRDYIAKIVAAFVITATLGFGAKLVGAELPETATPVAVALIVGGFIILVAEHFVRRHVPADNVTWVAVAAVGIAQVVAGVFPGTSRSGAAVFAAMFAGVTLRSRAAEFAFLVGIPTMFAATAYELLKTLADDAATGAEAWGELAVAFAAAAVTGFAAVKWLLGFISTHTFTPFAYYRIVLGALLLLVALP
jgi:undecaprenyl-diphosphatase